MLKHSEMKFISKSEGLYGAIPHDIFAEKFNEIYTVEMTAVSEDLVRLNTNLFLANKLIKFRFDLFGDYHNTFWYIVLYAMVESSIVTVFRIAFDQDPESVTLPRLKNQIGRELKNHQLGSEFFDRIKKLDFEKKIEEVKKEIIQKRHKLVAHLDSANIFQYLPKNLKAFSEVLEELTEATNLINEYFDALSFGAQSAKLPLDYYDKEEIDLDCLLDGIAKNSSVLNMPEHQPEFWPFYKKSNLDKNSLAIISKYRKKFGLSAIS